MNDSRQVPASQVMPTNKYLEPSLRFEPGRFVLTNPSLAMRKELGPGSEWRCIGGAAYETKSLRAAAAFRSAADLSAQDLFNRAFQSRYPSPRLPRLAPLRYLDAHQVEGVKWILERKRSYLAHAPGAGKTCTAITAALLSEGKGQVLFIVPPSLTRNWEVEISKFLDLFEQATAAPRGWVRTGVVGRSVDQDSVDWGAHFLIVPDSMLTKVWVQVNLVARDWRFVAVDEASRFKEMGAERSLAFYGGSYQEKQWPGLFQYARHVVFLDGSPMPNRPSELWAPTYALHPEAIDCMGYRDFGFRYCGARMNERGEYEFKYSSNEEELKAKLQGDFMHVVKEEELSHPERKRSLLFMHVDVRTADHKAWERKNLTGMKFDDLDEESSQGELARFRSELGMRKVPWVAGYVQGRLDAKPESILLFAWHRDVVAALTILLAPWKPGIVYGGTPEEDRERVFKEFQLGTRRLIIGNIAAMGRGHNLQKADRVIFAEYSWSDETNKQAEKRASRRGSEKEFVRCEYVVCPGSMDEPVLQALFTKESRVKRIIG